MKKFLALSLLLGATAAFSPATEARAAERGTAAVLVETNSVSPQIYRDNRRWNRRGARVVTRTRIVRSGWRTYREVWQYRYLPNGRVTSRLLSRTRIR